MYSLIDAHNVSQVYVTDKIKQNGLLLWELIQQVTF